MYLNLRQPPRSSRFDSVLSVVSLDRSVNRVAVLFRGKRRPSLYTLAEQLKRRSEYRIIYEHESEMMHSSRMDPHIRVSDQALHIRALRELTDLPLVAQLLMGQAVMVYKCVLAKYRPNERDSFARKYAEAWRQVFLSKRVVKYNYEDRRPLAASRPNVRKS
jgi:hypothetical protein